MHSLNDTPEGTWGNTILYRLGVAIGYPQHEGVITAQPGDILNETLSIIETSKSR